MLFYAAPTVHIDDVTVVAGIEGRDGMNLKGVFTRDRRPKMAAHFLRSRLAGR